MRTSLRVAGIIFLLAVVAGGYWTYRLVWGTPFNFDHLIDDPQLLSNLGIIDGTVLDFHSIGHARRRSPISSAQPSLRLQDRHAQNSRTARAGFDLKAFHDVILDGGAMPLTVLETRVDAWIKDRKGGR